MTLKREIKKYRLIGVDELKNNLNYDENNKFRRKSVMKSVKELIEQRDLIGYELKYGRIIKK